MKYKSFLPGLRFDQDYFFIKTFRKTDFFILADRSKKSTLNEIIIH